VFCSVVIVSSDPHTDFVFSHFGEFLNLGKSSASSSINNVRPIDFMQFVPIIVDALFMRASHNIVLICRRRPIITLIIMRPLKRSI
jgi:hypothetical protein